MQPPSAENNRWHPAACRAARRLLIIATGATLLVISAMAVHLWLRTTYPDERASAWMSELRLSAPALQTAGTPMRHPETMHPAIDLRYGAGLEISP